MSIGVTTNDRYVAVGLVARGGMGEVLLGVRRAGDFQRLVAIKRLRGEYRDDVSFRQMFLDEARIAGLIRHPNVVAVLDVGDDSGGPYLVMDFIEGVTLSRLLKVVVAAEEMVPVQVAVRIVAQIARGLTAAHELQGADGAPLTLIHRDISPQNILLGFDGVARLTDFGIAKAAGRTQNTTTGLLKGKAGYMSPEQLRFLRPTQRSDLFSLGVVLHELLSAKRLYAGDDAVTVAQQILTEPPPDIFAIRDDVPPALIELGFELLAKEACHRPESARAVAGRLEEIVDELVSTEGPLRLDEFLATQVAGERESLRARNDSLVNEWKQSVDLTQQGARRKRTHAWLAVAVVGALAIGGVVFGLVALSDDASTRAAAGAASAPPASENATNASPSPQDAREAIPALPTETETANEPVVEVPHVETRAHTRRRQQRARGRMRASAAAANAGTDDGFSALELIRMTR